jgi:hypothetical protein
MSGESVLEDTLFVHVEAAALIAHITSNSAPSSATQSTCPKDYAHAIDPERTPDYRLWLEATRKEYELLDKTMGFWTEVVDIDTLHQDANLIGVKWVFKIKYKNGEYERHKARIVALGARTSTSSRHFRQLLPMSRSDWYLPLLHCISGME